MHWKKFLTPRGKMAGLMQGAGRISLTLVYRYVSARPTLLSTTLYSSWASLMEIAPAITLPSHTHSFIVICLETWRLSWQYFKELLWFSPPLKKLCCFCLIILGGRRQVLPLAGCAACLTEKCEGPGLSYSRASQVDPKKISIVEVKEVFLIH